MKRIFLMLFMVSTLAVYAQPPVPAKDLSNINTVNPKKGQKMAFEAAWKVHVAKFHQAGEKVSVYEIITGPHAGSYHIVSSGRSYADFDKGRTDANAHSLDLDKTFFPYLEETMNGVYRFIDSLSFRPDTTAESFTVNVSHLKQGLNMNDYRRELARAVKMRMQLNMPFWNNLSYSYFEQLWDGSDQVTVNVRSLKDGFKSLEPNYYGQGPAGAPGFRDLYAKTYGHTAWDERVKMLEGAVVKSEDYIMKLRKDLSSQ
jgi:hypothetical protein